MPKQEREFQKEVKKIWGTTQARLKVLGREAALLARKGEQQMARAARIGRIQIDVLSIKRKRDIVHQEIGRLIVELSRQKKDEIDSLPGIRPRVARSAALARQLSTRRNAMAKVRASRKKTRSKNQGGEQHQKD